MNANAPENSSPVIRQATATDAPGIARLHMQSWRATYKGMVPDHFLANLQYDERLHRWETTLNDPRQEEFVYVAEDATGVLMGFASGRSGPPPYPLYQGELRTLHIARPYQRRGIGRRLFLTVVARLAQGSIHSLLLWVLAANPACRFYERLGGQPVAERRVEVGRVWIDEIAYGWRDTALLRGNPEWASDTETGPAGQ